jgi:hypothetical protein
MGILEVKAIDNFTRCFHFFSSALSSGAQTADPDAPSFSRLFKLMRGHLCRLPNTFAHAKFL